MCRMCRNRKKSRHHEEEQPDGFEYHYVIESTIFRIFMFFSVLAMVVSAFYTSRNLLYYEQLYLIEETVRP